MIFLKGFSSCCVKVLRSQSKLMKQSCAKVLFLLFPYYLPSHSKITLLHSFGDISVNFGPFLKILVPNSRYQVALSDYYKDTPINAAADELRSAENEATKHKGMARNEELDAREKCHHISTLRLFVPFILCGRFI